MSRLWATRQYQCALRFFPEAHRLQRGRRSGSTPEADPPPTRLGAMNRVSPQLPIQPFARRLPQRLSSSCRYPAQPTPASDRGDEPPLPAETRRVQRWDAVDSRVGVHLSYRGHNHARQTFGPFIWDDPPRVGLSQRAASPGGGPRCGSCTRRARRKMGGTALPRRDQRPSADRRCCCRQRRPGALWSADPRDWTAERRRSRGERSINTRHRRRRDPAKAAPTC